MKLNVFLLAALLVFSSAARAQQAEKYPCPMPGTDNPTLGIQTIRLWPGDAPEAHGKACEDTPTLTVFQSDNENKNAPAALILPGGAYIFLSGIDEGRQIADWFSAHGFRAFILGYRLSSKGYLLPVPLMDARRAIQTLRARSTDFQIDPKRIVVVGFSAGGHLGALAATQPVPGDPKAADPVERVSSRPDFLVLGYPWIGAISSDTSHLSYCKLFDVMDRCEALRAAYSPDLFVTKDTPPTFLMHAFADDTVPVEQGLRFYAALVKAGVPSEAHFFSHGTHGFSLGEGNAVLDQWPALLENWLRDQGLMRPARP